MSFRLEVRCCFCGGRLDIDEASRCTRCSHCGSIIKIMRDRVPTYMIRDDVLKREVKFLVDRHLKTGGRNLVSSWNDLQKVYLPFRRVTGTVFRIGEKHEDEIQYDSEGNEVRRREKTTLDIKLVQKDVSYCASDEFDWGLHSLGIRTQTVALAPLDEELASDGLFMRANDTPDEGQKRLSAAARSMASIGLGDRAKTQLDVVGLEQMLIYFPIWIGWIATRDGRFMVQFDPVAKRVASLSEGEMGLPESVHISSDGSVRAAAHRCPNCGSDFPQAEKSVVYFCDNCRRLYSECDDGYDQVLPQLIGSDDKDANLFPFWVFDVEASAYDGRADLLQVFKLSRFRGSKFYIPAFNVTNPSRILRLIGQYNSGAANFTFENRIERRYTFSDVVLPKAKAREMIFPLAAAIAASRGYRFKYDSPSRGEGMAEPDLVWMPYRLEKYFWLDQATGAAIEKAAVGI